MGQHKGKLNKMDSYKIGVYDEPPEEAEIALGRVIVPVCLPVDLMNRMEIYTFFNPLTRVC